MSYDMLSHGYDPLTVDVNYSAVAGFIQKSLLEDGNSTGIVLDLACGTGTLTYLLAHQGYETIGIDISEDMLAVAYNKGFENPPEVPPVFIRQDMRNLDLYGTVDACVCMLDSINHITVPAELLHVFKRINLFLNPGGLFIFDINTVAKLQGMEGQSYTDEVDEEGLFCAWRVALTDTPNVYQFIVDMFALDREDSHGEIWRRGTEEHYEYAYEVEDIITTLTEVGFIDIKTYSDLEGSAPLQDSKRIYFTCKSNLNKE